MALSDLSEPAALEPGPATTPARLQSIAYATEDVRLFEFVPLRGAFPLGEAGAHIDVHLPNKRLRQYSLITPLSSRRNCVIAVKREPNGRGGSIFLHDEARVGSEIVIGRPRNNFALDEDAADTLLLAGGIGITPIYSMFIRLVELGRRVRLHYWCRSDMHALFRDELTANPLATIHAADSDRPSIADVLATAGQQTEIYCCGPSRMLEACEKNVVDASRLHIERFGGDVAKLGDAARSFTVRLTQKKIDVEVDSGQTILEALLALDIDVPYSCEEGLCGACETKVISGAPVHCDRVRSAEENDRRHVMMICCSRSRDRRLELDI